MEFGIGSTTTPGLELSLVWRSNRDSPLVTNTFSFSGQYLNGCMASVVKKIVEVCVLMFLKVKGFTSINVLLTSNKYILGSGFSFFAVPVATFFSVIYNDQKISVSTDWEDKICNKIKFFNSRKPYKAVRKKKIAKPNHCLSL